MISAADFDEVFGWIRAQTAATLPSACVVDPVVDADLRSRQASVDGQNASGYALRGELRHTSHSTQATVESRPRDLAEIAN